MTGEHPGRRSTDGAHPKRRASDAHPLRRAGDKAQPKRRAGDKAETGNEGKERPKILVVEDDPVSRMLITYSLKKHGFDTVEAHHGADAIRVLQETPAVDLVFTDVCLPGNIDGVAVVRWIYAHRPELPVVLGTGTALGRKQSMLLKQHRTFLKPYRIPELVAHIRALAPGAWQPHPPRKPESRRSPFRASDVVTRTH
jgi:CheY-like chemotaxis protein